MTHELQKRDGMTYVKTSGLVTLDERREIIQSLKDPHYLAPTGIVVIDHRDAEIDISLEEAFLFGQQIIQLRNQICIFEVIVIVNDANRAILDMSIMTAVYSGVFIHVCLNYAEALKKTSKACQPCWGKRATELLMKRNTTAVDTKCSKFAPLKPGT